MHNLACVETRACFQDISCFVINKVCDCARSPHPCLILGSSPSMVIDCIGIHRAVQRTYSSRTLLVRTYSTPTYLACTDTTALLAVRT